jgi:RNA polymerase sigma-70 factor (ECF subfamily)
MAIEARVQDRLAAGDYAGAATEAIRGLGSKVVGYMRALFHDEADVADAFSLWAENLWKGMASFENRSSFRTWALRLAWNAALNIRDEAHRRRERRFVTGEASLIAEDVRSKSFVRVEQRRQNLLELRRHLSLDEQTLLFLRVDQGLPWTDIAQVLSAEGKPVDAGTIGKRFERLKARLAKLAKEQGLLE